jgi:hypothetical protein
MEVKNEHLTEELAKIKPIIEDFSQNERLGIIRLERVLSNISQIVESKETLKSFQAVIDSIGNS